MIWAPTFAQLCRRPLATMTACWLVVAWGWSAPASAEGRIDLVRLGDRLRIVVPLPPTERPVLDQRGSIGRVAFDEPVDIEVPPLGEMAKEFLQMLTLGDEGRELVFTIGPDMTAARALSGPRQLVVEIRQATAPEPLTRNPPSVARTEPPKPEPAAGPTPALRLRTGKHPGFVRIVIEGATRDNFSIERLEQALRLVGAVRDPKAGLAGLAGLGDPIIGVDPSEGAITLGLRRGTRIEQSSLAAGKIVIDLHAGERTMIEPAAGPSPPQAAHPPIGPPPGDEAAVVAALPPFPFPVMRPAGEAAPVTPAAPRQARTQPLMGMDRLSPEVAATMQKALSEAAPPAPVAPEAPLVLRGFSGGYVHELILGWPGPGPTPAAIFLYGGELWTVFARPASEIDADRAGLAKSLGGAVRRVRQETVADATVLRFELARPVSIRVARRDQDWIVRLDEPGSEAVAASGGTELRREKDRLVLGKSGSLVELDAELGGAPITVLATIDPNVRMAEGHRFVDLEFLPTAQGFAWRHVADGVSAESGGGRTVIGREHGLRLGEPLLDLEEPRAVADLLPAPPITTPSIATPAPDPHLAARSHEEPPPVAVTPSVSAKSEPAAVQPAHTPPEPPKLDPPKSKPPEPEPWKSDQAHIEPPESTHSPAEPKKPELLHAEPAKTVPAHPQPAEPAVAAKQEPPRSRPPQHEPTEPIAVPKIEGIRLAGLASDNDETSRLQERELVEGLVGLSGELALQRRYAIARHLLARGKSAEALYYLESEPGAGPPDATLRGLTSVAAIQLSRFTVAAESLADKSFDGDQEASLWRAIVAAEQERWADAAKALQASGRIFASYSPALQKRYGPLVARIATEAGRANAAFATIDRLRGIDLDDRERARLDYVDGLARERDGQDAEAKRLWEGLVQGSDRENQTRARFALTRMAFEKGGLPAAAAMLQLQQQQLTWRGHPEEPEFLALLAAVQTEAGATASALATWKTQLQRHPTDPRNDIAADAMQTLFRDAVAGKSSPPMAPLDALEIYRSFPELLPAGEDGAKLLRDLARRLAMADLPQTAANLLEEAVLVRAEPAARPAIALEAAEQRLADGDREAAKRLLDTYPPPADAPAEMHARQAKIRSALLSGAGAATELARGSTGDPGAAQSRQLDAAWQARDWPRVIELGQELLQQRQAGAPLVEHERALPLRMAVAAALSGDRAALTSIDAAWSKLLANTAEGRMLRLLVGAGDLDAGGIEQVIAALDAKTKAVREGLGAVKR